MPPHLTSGNTGRRGKGFPTNCRCHLKLCALSRALTDPCGKCGGKMLEIKIDFSVFSETQS